MANIGSFPVELIEELEKPNATITLLAKFDFNDGELIQRFSYTPKKLVIDGETWHGFGNQENLNQVGVTEIEQSEVDVANKVQITLGGIDDDTFTQLIDDVKIVYGSFCQLYVQVFDVKTYQPIGNKVSLFDGFCGMVKFKATKDTGVKKITIPADSIWSSKNYASGGRLNDADQKARYPDDRGLELVGSMSAEKIR